MNTYEREVLLSQARKIELAGFHRIVRNEYRDDPRGAQPAATRFGDPAQRYSVLYAAETLACALWEAVFRDRFASGAQRRLPRSDIDERVVAVLRSAEPLMLVDLRRDGAVRIGASPSAVRDPRYAEGQGLSQATYNVAPEIDGFLYPSWHTEENCIAVFDRAIPKLTVSDVIPLAEHSGLLPALDDYRVALLRPPK